MHGQLWIDVNGTKKPNTLGRDIFTFILADNGKIYPLYGLDYSLATTGNESQRWQNRQSWGCGIPGIKSIKGADGWGCTARLIENNWVMDY